MNPRAPIRRDIHERFITIVAQAEAKLEDRQKAVERRRPAAPAPETRERVSGRPSRVASAVLDMDGDDDSDGEPSTLSQGSRSAWMRIDAGEAP